MYRNLQFDVSLVCIVKSAERTGRTGIVATENSETRSLPDNSAHHDAAGLSTRRWFFLSESTSPWAIAAGLVALGLLFMICGGNFVIPLLAIGLVGPLFLPYRLETESYFRWIVRIALIALIYQLSLTPDDQRNVSLAIGSTGVRSLFGQIYGAEMVVQAWRRRPDGPYQATLAVTLFFRPDLPDGMQYIRRSLRRFDNADLHAVCRLRAARLAISRGTAAVWDDGCTSPERFGVAAAQPDDHTARRRIARDDRCRRRRPALGRCSSKSRCPKWAIAC